METITQERISEAARRLAQDNATLKELKGVTNDELEAVYSLGFGYYRTGKFAEAAKLFQFLVLFDHLNAKYWFALGAVQQATKDWKNAIASYSYSSFLDLTNPKPQYHAAECFLASGDKVNAASALCALDEYCPTDTETGREYRSKAAELRKAIGEDAFKELEAKDAKEAK